MTIGGSDVSNELISIKVQDQIETDSDPGKMTIVLANRLKKGYTTAWPPQTTPVKIIIKNWVYNTESERKAAGGHAEVTYLVAYGHVTDISRNHEEITVMAECDLGHLADAISQNYDSTTYIMNPLASKVLTDVLKLHKGLDFHLKYLAHDIILNGGKKYNSDQTFQDVCEDIRNDVGAVYYFSEDGTLEFRDPAATRGDYDLDPYVTNPDDTSSIMGFRNKVTVIGSQSQTNGEDGITTPGSDTIQATAQDDQAFRDAQATEAANNLASEAKNGNTDAIATLGLKNTFTQDELDKAVAGYISENGGPGSIEGLGPLEAPTDRAPYCKSVEECQKRANLLLNFYKLYKNALTKPKVAGIVPLLHSVVSYSVFIPISEGESSAGAITGVVVARSIEYSIDGLETELTVSPGATDMENYVGDDLISDFVEHFGAEEE